MAAAERLLANTPEQFRAERNAVSDEKSGGNLGKTKCNYPDWHLARAPALTAPL